MNGHDMVKKWDIIDRHAALDYGLFKIWKKQARSPRTGDINEVLSIEFPHWVMTAALTPEGEIVMVRQYRHGSEEICLELPGGLVDAEDVSPEEAARRELLEETGYLAEEMIKLGECHPQPAILSNQCYFYLAENVEKVGQSNLDAGEDIDIVLVPSHEAAAMLERGEITNGMVQLALLHFSAGLTQSRKARKENSK
jgi:8-oxo-dGTP pyrophosphatase MutT (NUDIX family)